MYFHIARYMYIRLNDIDSIYLQSMKFITLARKFKVFYGVVPSHHMIMQLLIASLYINVNILIKLHQWNIQNMYI